MKNYFNFSITGTLLTIIFRRRECFCHALSSAEPDSACSAFLWATVVLVIVLLWLWPGTLACVL